MKIRELQLKNFRCFFNLNIKFSDDYTIFIGNNGAGKSSILNALQLMLQTIVFNTQYDLTKSKADLFADQAIQVSDARLYSTEIGTVIDQQPQFPVVIKITADIGNVTTSWTYELINSLSRESNGTNDVLNFVQDLQKNLSAENKVTCPVIEHYHARNLDNELDYSNLLAVCTGNSVDNSPIHQHCDTKKGEQALHINPQNSDHISMINYKTDGTIFCPDNPEFDRDLNDVLNLNDDCGYLKINRKNVLRALQSKLHSTFQDKKATIAFLQKTLKFYKTPQD